jgi:hypothetical protein
MTQQWTDGATVIFAGPVVRATYGPAGSNQDFTAAVQALQARGCNVVNGGISTVVGDPNPGVPKIFQVWYAGVSVPSQQGADGGNGNAMRQGSYDTGAVAQFNPQRAVVPALALGLGSVAFSSVHEKCGEFFRIGQPAHSNSAGAWCAASGDPQGKEWVNISFPSAVFVVCVRVQGRTPEGLPDGSQHVKKLHLYTSDLITRGPDGGVVWVPVAGPDGNVLLDANNDNVNIATLNVNRAARAVRMVPIVVNNHCSMRFEVYVQLLS